MQLSSSVVLQALMPFYTHAKSSIGDTVTVKGNTLWFFADQLGVKQEKIIEIPCALLNFAHAVQGVEVGYREHQPEIIKQAAQSMLAHIAFTREKIAPYLYQAYQADKISGQLQLVCEQLFVEAAVGTYSDERVQEYRTHIRELYEIHAYKVS